MTCLLQNILMPAAKTQTYTTFKILVNDSLLPVKSGCFMVSSSILECFHPPGRYIPKTKSWTPLAERFGLFPKFSRGIERNRGVVIEMVYLLLIIIIIDYCYFYY